MKVINVFFPSIAVKGMREINKFRVRFNNTEKEKIVFFLDTSKIPKLDNTALSWQPTKKEIND